MPQSLKFARHCVPCDMHASSSSPLARTTCQCTHSLSPVSTSLCCPMPPRRTRRYPSCLLENPSPGIISQSSTGICSTDCRQCLAMLGQRDCRQIVLIKPRNFLVQVPAILIAHASTTRAAARAAGGPDGALHDIFHRTARDVAPSPFVTSPRALSGKRRRGESTAPRCTTRFIRG